MQAIYEPKGRAREIKDGTITSHGYKLIYVGKQYPSADVRGYIYEHRLKVEQFLGRQLRKGEQIHHKNNNRLDNSLGNLEIVENLAQHKVFHRGVNGKNRQMPNEINILICCACGCNEIFTKYDKYKRPRRYINGHIRKGKRKKRGENILIECACGCRKVFEKYDTHYRSRKYINGHNRGKEII